MSEIIQNIWSGFQMLPKTTMYILFACIAFAVIVLLFRIISKVKRAAQILGDKSYRKNPAGTSLSSTQQSALNVGAINSEQTMFYADSLSTGGDKTTLRNNLSSYYGIEAQPGSAEKTLNWLYTEGHRVYFDIIRHDYSPGGNDASLDYHAKGIHIDAEKLSQLRRNLEESVSSLIRAGFIRAREDIATMSIMAWDMGRLVNITRACFECGYITESKAWDFINRAHEESKKVYANWESLAAGYIVGRAMWSGDNIALNGLMSIAKSLLSDTDSPWQQTSLH